MKDAKLILGAVAYDPKVVTIWEGFKAYFEGHGLLFDYVLYSNYERQVEALFEGHIHVAWNSPLAWVRAQRMALAQGVTVRAVAMRDTDCDLRSVIVVRTESSIASLEQLRGGTIGFGAIDSPQATLIPMDLLRQGGLTPETDFKVRRFDILAGKHGDHIGGERAALQALMAGEVDAACMIEGNYLAFLEDGCLPPHSTQVLKQTGTYDHCNFTAGPHAPSELVSSFADLLLGMSWEDPAVRPLLELEGLKAWRRGRSDGYDLLARAVDDERFYDSAGHILAAGYRY